MQGSVPNSPVAQRIVIPSTGQAFGAIRNRAADEAWRQLRSRSLQAESVAELSAVLTTYLSNHVSAVLTAWYHPADPATGQTERIESLNCPADGLDATLRQELKTTAEAAYQAGQLVTRTSSRPRIQLLAAPLPSPMTPCLLLLGETGRGEVDLCGQVAQLLSVAHEWVAVSQLKASQEETQAIAAIAELVAAVQQADDVDKACQRMADELSRCLGGADIYLGLQAAGGTDCRLNAVSGRKQIDRYCDETRLAESVFLESLTRRSSAIWPAASDRNRHALLAHQQFAEFLSGTAMVSVPLLRDDGTRVGCVIAVHTASDPAHGTLDSADNAMTPAAITPLDRTPLSAEAMERFLRTAAFGLTGCLSVIQKLADSRWLTVRQTLRRWMTRRRKQAIATTILILCAVMCLPVRYKVSCDAELQPVARRFVAAPFDASLEECFVEPGDTVDADQLLARMDGREIRWELAGVQADLNRAVKQRNTHMNNHEFGEAEIARFEIERLQSRADLLTDRTEHLELRSPISGIVVSGDHREAEGVPLKTGDSLFEVAPLDRMIIEVAIPEEDIRHVHSGQPVHLQLEALPETIVEAEILRVHPRAELRENENIFIAEAEV
ncbi:MAG: HlyD family efflux transporter periplasmic adaptor subunit, partial [Planctomycetaceae bacterium]|nr:HlyD family efflux transporter periplasmic adaptor subunit [Planctomycetaceae bacterium]